MKTIHTKSFRKIWLVLILLGVGGLFFGGFWFAKVNKIECKTTYGICPEYYLSRINFIKGKSMFALPTNADLKSVLASYVEISEVALIRKWPSTVVLTVKLHEPFGVVNNYLVDDGGQVLGIAANSTLPILSSDIQVLPGKKLDQSVITSLEVLKKLAEVFPVSSDASVSGNILRLNLNYQTAVVFDVVSLPDHWSDSLQLIFTRGKVEDKVPKKIDMRFNNPIIVY